jgi:cytochrome c biogenesis protein CcdA
MQPEQQIEGLVRLDKGDEPLLVPYVNPRRIGMKIVSNQELLDIGSVSTETALFFALLGVSSGGLIASVASLTTATITSPYVWAAWFAALFVSLMGTIAFGFLSYFSFRKGKKRISLIEKESAAREIELLGR